MDESDTQTEYVNSVSIDVMRFARDVLKFRAKIGYRANATEQADQLHAAARLLHDEIMVDDWDDAGDPHSTEYDFPEGDDDG